MNVLVLLLGLVAPILLLPLEAIAPYPHFLEELVKMGLIVWLISGERARARPQLMMAFGIGGLFALSETILYLNNFLALANGGNFVPRLVLTGSLHMGTSLLLYLTWRRGRVLGLIGLGLAILTHFLFNSALGLKI